MLDFTSALYLGIHHPHSALRPWHSLTTGRPAILQEPLGAETTAQGLAQLIGCPQAVLATSSLHVFWDIFEVLAQKKIAIFIDKSSYPLARWGAERLAAQGVPLTIFPQHDPAALQRSLLRCRSLQVQPVVLTDGLCPATGRIAPLSHYLRLVQEQRGWLVVDDTQALGILGRQGRPNTPYGTGGGGTAAWSAVKGPGLIVAASLAKGFGAPLAVVAASENFLARYKEASLCRVHCSAPSAAAVAAAAHALRLNQYWGNRLRQRLAARVQQFRSLLAEQGIVCQGGLFPVQTLEIKGAAAVHQHLEDAGVWTVLHQDGKNLSFLLTAAHEPWEIQQAVYSLTTILPRNKKLK